MNSDKEVVMSCPMCGSSASHDFSGNDLLFSTATRYNYNRCDRCEIVFQTPMPNPEQIASYYPEQYKQYQPERPKQLKDIEKGALKAVFGYQHLDAPNAFILAGQLLGRTKYTDTPPLGQSRQIGHRKQH